MNESHAARQVSRRRFLETGAGSLGLATFLADDGLLAASSTAVSAETTVRHHAPRAERCIFIFLMGGPSQVDLYDPKPRLRELDGQAPPASVLKGTRFAFLQKDSVRLLGSPREFRPHGQSGIELSDLLPHLATCVDDITLIRSVYTDSFNHAPAEILITSGAGMMGRPTLGSWLNYGLGSPSRELPGYVVLASGRIPQPDPYVWSQGFLPPRFQGVPFRSSGEPVLNLSPPVTMAEETQHAQALALKRLNHRRLDVMRDPEIAARISAYELAFRMQVAAPHLVDLSGESRATRLAYGLDRDEGALLSHGGRGGGKGMFHRFATHCVLARRLVERGVRFVQVCHTSWDQHDNLSPELEFNCRMVDQPIAALLKDLKARGLLDSTLVVCASEFGRTPLGENRKEFKQVTGRDHHPFAFSLWMAGGGVRGGVVHGKTDELGWGIVENPVHIHDLHATILHLFGIDHRRLTYRFQGRDFRLTDVAGNVVDAIIA